MDHIDATLDPDIHPTKALGRRSAPDAVWLAVREEYLGGMSGPEVCRRYGVGLSALRDRAAREGWRRSDQSWSPPNALDPWDEGMELETRVDGDLDRVEFSDLVYVAHRRMMRAVIRGDAAEAMRWRRVREAMEIEDAEVHRAIAEDEVRKWHRANADDPVTADVPDAPDASDSSDSSDGVCGGSVVDAILPVGVPVRPS